MDLLDGLTPYQKVSLVTSTVADSIRLQPYDEIVRVMISGDRIGITLRRFSVTERATETRLTQAKLITQAWNFKPGMGWVPQVMDGSKLFVQDDDAFKPLIISHRGGKTIDEYRDMLYWDALCARPGQGRLGQRDYDQVQADTAKRWVKAIGMADYHENTPV